MYILIGLLTACIVFTLLTRPTKRIEGYESYDETTCISLASQNADNITALQKDVTALLALQTNVTSIQASTDANTTQLKSMVDQVYNTPST